MCLCQAWVFLLGLTNVIILVPTACLYTTLHNALICMPYEDFCCDFLAIVIEVVHKTAVSSTRTVRVTAVPSIKCLVSSRLHDHYE
jgi:hypothetical protein